MKFRFSVTKRAEQKLPVTETITFAMQMADIEIPVGAFSSYVDESIALCEMVDTIILIIDNGMDARQ